MSTAKRKQQILYIVELSMLVALVVVLQLVGGSIPLGMIPLTFSLIPIVVGGIVLGPVGGGILGLVFGIITVIMTPMNAILTSLFQYNPVCYVIVAILKATLAGFFGGLIYRGMDKLLKNKLKYVSTTIASVSVPIINTGLFIIGMFLFFNKQTALFPELFPSFFGAMDGSFQIVIIGLVGFNFVGEFLVNLLLSPGITRIVDIVNTKIKK